MAEEKAAPPAEGDQAAAPAKGGSPWPALLVVIVLMPVVSWASTNFLILPKLKATVVEGETAAAAHGGGEKAAGGHGGGGHGEKKEAPKKAEKSGGHGGGGHGKKEEAGADANGKFSCDFESIVVNLAGAMGTRYLKASFTLLSSNSDLKSVIEENKKQLQDVAITVLSSRSMADLEQPGAKNIVRNDLQANFNQALSSDLVEQIYFSEFVVQ